MDYFIGIDTSCYTTSVAAVSQDQQIISVRRMLVVPQGSKGLRQSDAVFQHLKNLPELISTLFHDVNNAAAVCAAVAPRPVDGSYMPVFVVARSFALAISASLRIPFYESTHQEGHIAAALPENEAVPGKFLALHVSGGTTEILEVTKKQDGYGILLLGGTSDISAGQLIDRTGVMLGCPFPCGRELEEACSPSSGNDLPVSVDGLKCSFSGSENRIMQLIGLGLEKGQAAHLVFSVIASTLSKLICNAYEMTGLDHVVLTGGVMQNELIRAILDRRFENGPGIRLFFSPPEYAGDNAAGIASICKMKYTSGR